MYAMMGRSRLTLPPFPPRPVVLVPVLALVSVQLCSRCAACPLEQPNTPPPRVTKDIESQTISLYVCNESGVHTASDRPLWNRQRYIVERAATGRAFWIFFFCFVEGVDYYQE